MNVEIYHFLRLTEAEGPGRRACVWVQGCSIRCDGCFNPHTWQRGSGHDLTVDQLTARILASPGVEGVTFLGGEPFEQAEALAETARRVRAAGLSVMTFTGFTLEGLREAGRPAQLALLAATDLLVDGAYVAALPDRERPWVGSTNQRFHFLTDRYQHLKDELVGLPDRLEVHLRSDGSVWVNGMSAETTLRALRRDLGLSRRTGR